MTDSGSKPPRPQNDLGGHEYTDEEQQLIHALAMTLRSRGQSFEDMNAIISGKGPRPRDYIFLYTKTAGFVYELAKNLEAYPLPPRVPKKSIHDWLSIVTDINFAGRKKAERFSATITDEEFNALTVDFPADDSEVDSVANAVREGIVDGETGALKNVRVSLLMDGKEIAHSGPGSRIENMDPERAKAILIRLCEAFPGLVSDEHVDGSSVIQELTLLLRSSL